MSAGLPGRPEGGPALGSLGAGNGNGVCDELSLLRQEASNKLLDDYQRRQDQLLKGRQLNNKAPLDEWPLGANGRRASLELELEQRQQQLEPNSRPLAGPDLEPASQHEPRTKGAPVGLQKQCPADDQDDQDPEQRRLLSDDERPGARRAGATEGQHKRQEAPSDSGEKRRALLARQESALEREGAACDQPKVVSASRERSNEKSAQSSDPESLSWCCPGCLGSQRCRKCEMFQIIRARKCQLVSALLLVIYVTAIYCLPFVKIEPKIVQPLPVIPFDFFEGPLKASTAGAFEVQHLFKGRLHGPESLAFDSQGNLYTAIEGGFVLYAHLNRSSPLRRAYLESMLAGAPSPASVLQPVQQQQQRVELGPQPALIKIAELNGPKPQSANGAPLNIRRAQRDSAPSAQGGDWRRECQLDEQVYGPQLFTTTTEPSGPTDNDNNSARPAPAAKPAYSFRSAVRVSRCSKPLGVRLSQDESSLYVVDTLSGLYRVNLRQAERGPGAATGQRQVTRLIDFRAGGGRQLLPAVQLEPGQPGGVRVTRLMNVSLKAIDDLVIEHNAGSGQGADLIYMTVASQVWPATSFVFDILEGRPSGLVLRFDTSTQQLAVLEPSRLALVRTSAVLLEFGGAGASTNLSTANTNHYHLDRRASDGLEPALVQPSALLGAPRLDENDVFDERPLNFPNGLELTDDRQALLIVDTANKRIIRHYLRGPRAGSSDLWAWTPNLPDNIRRGSDRRRETYWVVGCGHGPAPSAAPPPAPGGPGDADYFRHLAEVNQQLSSRDMFALLRNWPRVRKFILKNLYFIGALVEFAGEKLLRSVRVQDFGYELRTGSLVCTSGCSGMMILQYNAHGDIIRSVHSREFPNDLAYYSQVNELIDPDNAEHALYLGSPSYDYLTKLVLPTELREPARNAALLSSVADHDNTDGGADTHLYDSQAQTWLA